MASVTLELDISMQNDVSVVKLSGRMDASRVKAIREELTGLPKKGQTNVVLDLGQLDWIDSSGVGVLITLFKRAKSEGGDVKVANLCNQPAEIFRLMNLQTAFEVFESVPEAVAKLAS